MRSKGLGREGRSVLLNIRGCCFSPVLPPYFHSGTIKYVVRFYEAAVELLHIKAIVLEIILEKTDVKLHQ